MVIQGQLFISSLGTRLSATQLLGNAGTGVYFLAGRWSSLHQAQQSWVSLQPNNLGPHCIGTLYTQHTTAFVLILLANTALIFADLVRRPSSSAWSRARCGITYADLPSCIGTLRLAKWWVQLLLLLWDDRMPCLHWPSPWPLMLQSYIHGSSQGQYIFETYIVIFLSILDLDLCVISMVHVH